MKQPFTIKSQAPLIGVPDRASKAASSFAAQQSRDALYESQQGVRKTSDYLDQFKEVLITVDGVTHSVLARNAFAEDATASGGTPWRMIRQEGAERILRIYPSAVWDGKGNDKWPIYKGITATPESYFDVEIPFSPVNGYVWLDCVIDDTDDLHGKIVSAEVKSGERPSSFMTREGTTVNIPLASYRVAGASFVFDPLRSFVFILRRYGPPKSFTWDVEPMA